MARVKGGPHGHLRHQKVLKLNQGYSGSRHRLFRRANEAMLKSMFYATRDRRVRKRDLRRLWIVRINAAARLNGLSYSKIGLWNEESSDQPQPQDAGRSGRTRSTGICRSGCESKISIISSLSSEPRMAFCHPGFFIRHYLPGYTRQ